MGTELDAATQRQLDRGQRMVELLKQPQYQPFPMAEQVISIFAGTQGLLDDLPAKDVSRFEAALLQHIRDQHADIIDQIATSGEMPSELARQAAFTKVVREATRRSSSEAATAPGSDGLKG